MWLLISNTILNNLSEYPNNPDDFGGNSTFFFVENHHFFQKTFAG
jgi:hypothetical protein